VGDQIVAVRFSNTIPPTQANNFDVGGYRAAYAQLIAGYRVGDGKPRPGAPLAGGTPPLTQDVADRWAARYEWAMGLKLDDGQRQRCRDALVARWKENNAVSGAVNDLYLAELTAWEADAKQPAGPQAVLQRLRWRTRLWGDLCSREGESEFDDLLAADAAAHPQAYAQGMLRPAPPGPGEDKPLPPANAAAYTDYVEWMFGLKLGPAERGELTARLEADRHAPQPAPADTQRAMDFWSRLTRLSPEDRALVRAANLDTWMRVVAISQIEVDKYTVLLIGRQRPALARGGDLEPSLWPESVAGYVGLVCFQADAVAGGKATFEPTPQLVAEVGKQLAADYPQCSGRRKLELAEMPARLAELRAAWPRFSADERKAVLAGWSQWFAPLQLASAAPAVRDAGGLMRRVLEMDHKEDEAWKASPVARLWEQNRQAALSRIEANRHARAMYSTDPDHYELRSVPGR
jgi:hypothetical protein